MIGYKNGHRFPPSFHANHFAMYLCSSSFQRWRLFLCPSSGLGHMTYFGQGHNFHSKLTQAAETQKAREQQHSPFLAALRNPGLHHHATLPGRACWMVKHTMAQELPHSSEQSAKLQKPPPPACQPLATDTWVRLAEERASPAPPKWPTLRIWS